jgi:hypothetical protein
VIQVVGANKTKMNGLLILTSADISEIRLMMDVLLEIHLEKLVLVSSS